MLLTQERADKLSEILNADAVQAKELLELEPKEAVTRINALGHDFTAEELKEYGSTLRNNLSDSALAGVAGGVGDSASEDNALQLLSLLSCCKNTHNNLSMLLFHQNIPQ